MIDALITMLFGMLGIFLVMGLIILAISLITYFANLSKKEKNISE